MLKLKLKPTAMAGAALYCSRFSLSGLVGKLPSLVPGLLVQRVAPKLRTRDFCTAAANKGEEGNDEEDNFRKKMDQLRELKRQMEELDKEYDSYFTVDYALKFAKKGFKDSDDEEYVDSSDADKSSLEVSGPGEISSSEDDDYNR